jgi:hypothetical protein
MRMRTQGQTLRDIRAAIDARYAGQGPATDTPLPPAEA